MNNPIKDYPNKFPGTCEACGVEVAAQAGRWFRDPRNQASKVSCSSIQCGRKLNLKSVIAPLVPSVDGEGFVTIEIDDENKALLYRAGARWDRQRKQYRLNLTNAVMFERALEACRALNLEGSDFLEAQFKPLKEALQRNVEQAAQRARDVGAYPYQVEGVEWLAGRDRALLADDMGLGKTLQLLVAIPKDARVLVIAPKSLTMNWQSECAKWRSDLTTDRASKWQEFRSPEKNEVLVTHYECVRAHANAVAKGQTQALDFRGIVLIADEAHRTKNKTRSLTKAFRALSAQADRVWLATGTPLLGNPLDLWGVLESGGLGDLAFDRGFSGFYEAFNASPTGYGGSTVWGRPNPDVVPASLARVQLRRTKKEALPGLPSKIYVDLVAGRMSKSLTKALDKAQDKFGDVVDSGRLPAFEEMAKIRRLLAESRIPALLEWCADREDAGEPVLVFSAHRKPVDTLAEREGWAAITGDTSVEERQYIVETFQSGALKGVALTIGAGKEGLTLTAASTVLFVDRDWTPAMNLQAEDRICRIGQRADRCTVVRMVSGHALDRRIEQLLDQKMRLVNETIEAARNAEALERPEIGEYVPSEREADIWTPETEAEWVARVTEMERTKNRQERERLVDVARSKTASVVSRRGLQTRDFTLDQVAAMEEALMLLSNACDGARDQDGVGFNKVDTAYGKWLAVTGLLDDAAKMLAYDMLRKYQGQLGDALYQRIYGGNHNHKGRSDGDK